MLTPQQMMLWWAMMFLWLKPVETAGGAWIGSNVIKAHLQELERNQQAQAVILQAKIYWQAQVANYRAQADTAQAKLIECLKAGDHVGAAAAAKALTIACLHLIRLGAE